jgi:ubiquinone/menaquinone biosynthesis C-methylase UbiE
MNMKPTKELVLRVNELFHDIEGAHYHDKHEDIFMGDKNHWQCMARRFFQNRKGNVPNVILDIGTGTGFVPLQIGRFLSMEDVFWCTDISRNILESARKNLEETGHTCEYRYLKVDGDSISIPDASINMVTMNSVLHHIPNFDSLFRELRRVLKPNGHIVIAHEPNRIFFRKGFLWGNYVFFFLFSHPKIFAYSVLKFFGLTERVKRFFPGKQNPETREYTEMIRKINTTLLSERLIESPLSDLDIARLIDFHSPTAGEGAGSFSREKGIDMEEIMKRYLPGFVLEYYETYNHLFRISHKNALFRTYSRILGKIFPKNGATFFAVIRNEDIR